MTEELIDQMKKIQQNLLDFIERDENSYFKSLVQCLNDSKIRDSKNKLKAFLHLISNITNHRHQTNFYGKIENVLSIFKNDIKQFFSNIEIFNIFQSNKRILLFLMEEQLLVVDKFIAKKIISYDNKTQLYFYPEIEIYLKEEEEEFEMQTDFNEKRKIGENDDYICTLIRKDDVVEFISYTSKINLPLSKYKIPDSFYETNSFLITRKPSLIEYSAFFGSVQIFQYLFMNKAPLTQSLWLYAIHGQSPEIINILEENKVLYNDECLQESISCHYIDITNYLLDNYDEHINTEKIVSLSLQFYNFYFLQSQHFNLSSFLDLCKFDYFIIVESLVKSDIKINPDIISTALIFAVENENIEMIKLLLTLNDIDINYVFLDVHDEKGVITKKEKTALNCAFERENYEIIKLLLSCPAINLNNPKIYLDDRGREKIQIDKTILHNVIESNNVEILQFLLSNQNLNANIPLKRHYEYEPFEITDEEKTALELAVEIGNEEIIKSLLEYEKLDVNQKSSYFGVSAGNEKEIYSPFHSSIKNGNMEIIQLFLSCNRVDINQIYYTEYMSRGGIYDFDKEVEKTALTIAIENDNIELLKLLLSNEKLDLNIIYNSYYYHEESKKTALQMVVEKENIEMLQLLLSTNNIDINMTSTIKLYDNNERVKYEKTALFTAIEKGNEDMIKLLLSFNGIDINKITKYRKKSFKNIDDDQENEILDCVIYDMISPLDIAVDLKNINVIQLLLNSKNIEVNNKRKTEIIHMDSSGTEIAKRILKEETVLNSAIDKQNINIIQILMSYNKLDKDIKSSYLNDDCEIKEISPLNLAIEKRNKEIIKLLEK